MIQFNSQADARPRLTFRDVAILTAFFAHSRYSEILDQKWLLFEYIFFADAYLLLDTCFGGTSFIYKKLHKHSSILSVSYFFVRIEIRFRGYSTS